MSALFMAYADLCLLTLFAGDSQEHTQKPDYPVAHCLALSDGQYSQDTSNRLVVKVVLVELIVLSSFPAGRLITASLLDLSQIDHQLSMSSSRLLSIRKNRADVFAQHRGLALVWDFCL